MNALLSRKFSLFLQAATVFVLGLMAGFFATYSANVNLATHELDGPTYALMQSALNRNVRHALFFSAFFGPLILGSLTLLSACKECRRRWWGLHAGVVLAYALGIVLFTREVNLPLNYFIESWAPATLPMDWNETRDAWNRANLVRAFLSTILFAVSLGLLSLRLIDERRG
ncbi:DUF1772 domain-containing protein [Ottowia thiooxydans]|uniref:DUF1772 domain-containing protein n=1 Tax=Ottowia thiooxydans TaxID=219182 RepID=UPI0003FFD54B|nr:DUF1772 domain-containing protein [Ottowia thiooxydans]